MPLTEFCVKALGTSITIAADENADYLGALLENYQKELEKTHNSTRLEDPLKIALLTGFALCDEIEKLKSEIERLKREAYKLGLKERAEDSESKEAETLTLKLISRLENIFDTNGIGGASESAEAPLKERATDVESKPGARTSEDIEAMTASFPGEKPKIIKLANAVKNYPWGSAEWIPSLLGEKNPARLPWAELWMGVHPEGPSRLAFKRENEDGNAAGASPIGPLLSSVIAEDPRYYLGEETEKKFGGLPFLFKLLAADKPLSIQAHPNLEQAREGWDRENRAGIDFKAPERNYRDANHKPEIICALNPFTAMCGFREPGEIKTMLEAFSQNAAPSLKAALDRLASTLDLEDGDGTVPLKSFLASLFDMNETVRGELCAYALSGRALENSAPHAARYEKEFRLVSDFAGLYPGDAAVIAPLYLNLLELKPGEAVYLPAGVLHAYVNGLGVELMANSDNVLRGGLTPKHIDKNELFRVLNFNPWKPEILQNPCFPKTDLSESEEETKTAAWKYPSPCREFSLTFLRGGNMSYTGDGPLIILVTDGELLIGNGETATLRKGETAFIPAGEASLGLRFSGSYTACLAGTGQDSA